MAEEIFMVGVVMLVRKKPSELPPFLTTAQDTHRHFFPFVAVASDDDSSACLKLIPLEIPTVRKTIISTQRAAVATNHNTNSNGFTVFSWKAFNFSVIIREFFSTRSAPHCTLTNRPLSKYCCHASVINTVRWTCVNHTPPLRIKSINKHCVSQ